MKPRPIDFICKDCAYATLEHSREETLLKCSVFDPQNSWNKKSFNTHCYRFSLPQNRDDNTDALFPVDVLLLCATDKEQQAIMTYFHPNGREAWVERGGFYGAEWWSCIFSLHNDDENQSSKESIVNGRARVLFGKINDMGICAMSATLSAAAHAYYPRYTILAGICAGFRGETKIGDIITPNFIFDYSSGRIEEEGSGDQRRMRLRPRSTHKSTPNYLLNWCRQIGRDARTMDSIRTEWCGISKQYDKPEVIIKPLVSGPTVVNSSLAWDHIHDIHDKVVALEMEAYAIGYVAQFLEGESHKTGWLICKSVADYAEEKTDEHQGYAAFVSARFASLFMSNYIPSQIIDNKEYYRIPIPNS